ncbi:hypothetical protein CCACVL1_10857 [Corchorus capsularis]|uniref:Uncharacterized protein n=1 Tax=Corchorus capsularis TaxID=210143 RepID=A0A1R3IP51_COCAP|nr:hypothetical protein CCACVL1_10857 [Corchorus capsularis]
MALKNRFFILYFLLALVLTFCSARDLIEFSGKEGACDETSMTAFTDYTPPRTRPPPPPPFALPCNPAPTQGTG